MDESVNFAYDPKADVLYVSQGDPRPAISEEIEPGVLLRKDPDSGEVIGMTVIDFTKHWPRSPSSMSMPVRMRQERPDLAQG